MFLFVQRPTGEKIVCVAINRERKEILAEAQKLLESAVGKPILIYATPVHGPIEEILGGVDYQVHALGIWVSAVDRPRVVLTSYGDSLMGAMRSVSWQQFLQKMIGKGVDQVL